MIPNDFCLNYIVKISLQDFIGLTDGYVMSCVSIKLLDDENADFLNCATCL